MKISPIISQLSTKIHSTNIAKTARRGLLATAIALPTALSTQSCCALYYPCYNPYYVVPAPVVVPYVAPVPCVPCCPCPPPPPMPCF